MVYTEVAFLSESPGSRKVRAASTLDHGKAEDDRQSRSERRSIAHRYVAQPARLGGVLISRKAWASPTRSYAICVVRRAATGPGGIE